MNPLTSPPLDRRRAKDPVERPALFPLAVVVRACVETLEAIGFRHRRRIPVALLAFVIPFLYLALPQNWMRAQTLQQLLDHGRWVWAAQVTLALELGGLLLFKIVTLVPRMAEELRLVGVVRLQDLCVEGVALFHEQVHSTEAFRGWHDRVQLWFSEVEQELTEHFSGEQLRAFHSIPGDNLVRYRHAYDEAHLGWLNLLEQRLQVLRGVIGQPQGLAADAGPHSRPH